MSVLQVDCFPHPYPLFQSGRGGEGVRGSGGNKGDMLPSEVRLIQGYLEAETPAGTYFSINLRYSLLGLTP